MIMSIVPKKIHGSVLEAYFDSTYDHYCFIIKDDDNSYMVYIDKHYFCHMVYWNWGMGKKRKFNGEMGRVDLDYDSAIIDCDIEVSNDEEDMFIVRELILSKGKFNNIVFKDIGINNLGWR